MSFFDFFHEKNVCLEDGYIKKEPDEIVEGLSLGDRLRYALAWEDSEYFEALQDDAIQNEFIFKFFKMVVLGGSMCQYEDNIKEYLECIKGLYKDLVTVAKDPDSGEIKIQTFAFEIKGIDGNKDLWVEKEHP